MTLRTSIAAGLMVCVLFATLDGSADGAEAISKTPQGASGARQPEGDVSRPAESVDLGMLLRDIPSGDVSTEKTAGPSSDGFEATGVVAAAGWPNLRAALAKRSSGQVKRAAGPIDLGVMLSHVRSTRVALAAFAEQVAKPAEPIGVGEPAESAEAARASVEAGLKPITQVMIDITPPSGVLPQDYAGELLAAGGVTLDRRAGGETQHQVFYWETTNFCHRPLYFEQPNLERYGCTHGVLQPALSGAHFFATIPILPYKMVVQRPRAHVGTCDACGSDDHAAWPPWDRGAALVEGAAIAGMIFLIP